MKKILDACCGSRMFWFDRENPDVIFADNREIKTTLCDGRRLLIKPDIKMDFRDIDEIYEHEKETAEIIPIAIQHGIPAKKIMWCDSAEPDRIKEWNKAGYRARGVDKGGSKGSVNAQIDWLKGSVGKDHTIRRKIYVAPHCVNTIKELQQWKWKKDERTGEYLDDPVPVMDDAMAALRYAIEGWRKASRWLM